MANKNSKKTIKENQDGGSGPSTGKASSKVWGVSNPGKVANKYNNWGTKKGTKKD